MVGIQQFYGSLDENGNITDRMREVFLIHRENIIKNGKTNLPYSCYETQNFDNTVAVDDIRDREKYKSFHENWIDGLLTDCLRILNVESNISIPIFDPLALSAKLDPNASLPPLSFPTMLATLAIPPPLSIQVALLSLNIDIIKVPEYTEKIFSKVIKAPPVPEVKIPTIPSLSFPNLQYTVPILNLKDRQIAIYTSLPLALASLVQEIANPSFMAQLATNGPLILFEKACKALNAAMPKSSIENPTTIDANTGAIIASLSKPLASTALGVVVGASENGPAGGLGAIEPDKVKEPVERQPISTDSIGVPTASNNPGNIANRTTPEFRRKLFNICAELRSTYPEIQLQPEWLAAIMTIESAGTFLPNVRSGEISKKKPGGGYYQYGETNALYKGNQGPAVGLIQITKEAILYEYGMNAKLGKNYTLESIGAMTAVEQLDVVKDYFIAATQRPNGRARIKNPTDAYIAVFLPNFIGQSQEILASMTIPDKTRGPKIIEGNEGYVTGTGEGRVIKRSTISSRIEGLVYNALNKNGRIYCDVNEFVPGSGKLAPPAQ